MTNTHPWDKQYHIFFASLIFIGGCLCIGGIWISPLLVPGGVLIAGALGMWASAYTRMYPWRMDHDNTTSAQAMGVDNHNATNPIPVHTPDITYNILNQFNIYRQRSRSLSPPTIIDMPLHNSILQHSQSAPLPRTLDLV